MSKRKRTKKTTDEPTQKEVQLLEFLRQHPELADRFQSIRGIVENADGPLKSADDVEGLLIQEMRQLGNTSLTQWAKEAEDRVSKELGSQDSTVRSRKKKT